MHRRARLLGRVQDLCGREVLEIIDARDGWPGLASITTTTGPVPVAFHIGLIGRTHRERDEVERRFQNPAKGRPLQQPSGYYPALIGIWEKGSRPVLAGMDPFTRFGRETRQSFFVALTTLEQAAKTGWADHHSGSDELIVAFHPALLPTYIESRISNAPPPTELLHRVIDASGLPESDSQETRERARVTTSRIARDAAFSRQVIEAYDGFCAMCGLDFELLSGAHIYPVAAPNSTDDIWNGIALCGNHHWAFDKHVIWVDPESRRIVVHPRLHAMADASQAGQRFLEVTSTTLREPGNQMVRPRSEMFERRYSYFGERYEWAS